jgi:hypothetical protein
MPGRLLSEEPAIEGPARMKAKARMKLIVRIYVSGLKSRARCAFRWQLDSQSLFPDICSKTENGFVAAEICFIETSRRNNPAK